MFLVPHLVVVVLCTLCFVLNAISIGLCLSALVLLTLAYLGLGHLLSQSVHTASPSLPKTNSIETPLQSSESILPESSPEQLNLILYMLFYLSVAVLGVLGATTHYHHRKINFLACHVLLLFVIICFNLLAWFHFRTYSPLNTSPYEDTQLLITSLFDFLDFLVGLSLLICLMINRLQVGRKQRNSISPITDHSETSA